MQHLLKDTKKTFKKINRASLEFLKPHTSRETYKIVVDQTLKLLKGKDGAIILKNGRSFSKVYASSKKVDVIRIRKRGNVYNALKANKTFTVYAKDFKKTHPLAIQQGIRSILFMPLRVENNTIGLLLIRFTRDVVINQSSLEILKLFGSMVSMAITQTHLLNQIKNALETRDLFIALASHELKTPLTTTSIYAQLLEKKLSPLNNQESQWASQLLLETNRLKLLMNELLQVDQIQTGEFKYKWEKTDLLKTIKRAITNAKFMYPKVTIILNKDIPKKAFIKIGDANKLLQAFINVLTNAAKFSPLDTPILVNLEKKDSHYLITIADKGKGIPQAEITKIFDRFYKATHNYIEGMGLGLFLTKKIIDDHKGKITISSELNKGTIISINLPIE